ncbi:MAG: hypothetical protein ACM3ML_28615 [Micromonosporaceae bacterium]
MKTSRVAVRRDFAGLPGSTFSGRRRRIAFAVAVVFTCASLVQQVLYATGLVRGWPVSALRGSPMPLLLVAAPAWALSRPWPSPPPRLLKAAAVLARVPPWLALGLILLLTAALWHGLQGGLPYLGHDEAVYATKARSWLTGAPAAQWRTYRPVGLPALGWIALHVRNDVGAVRAVGLILALMTLAITYLVAAWLTGPRRAAVATLVVVSGWAFLRRLPEFLDDIAAAGLLLAVACLVIRARQRPGSVSLLAAAVVAVAAFYMRYGAVCGLIALGLAALVTWGWRGWITSWRDIAAGCLFVGGLGAHLVYSSRVAGSPITILFSALQVAHMSYFGEGLVYYALIFPFRLAGDLGGVVMAAGLIAAFPAARRVLRRGVQHRGVREVASPGQHSGAASPADHVRLFFALAAVANVLLLGLIAHGEERFVFLSVLLLVILGVDAIARYAGRWPAIVLAVITAFAALAAIVDYRVVVNGDLAVVTAERTSLVAVAQRISRHHPCLVVTGFQPEMGWYSGCATTGFPQAEIGRLPAGEPVYVVLFQRGRGQPHPAELRKIVAGRLATTTIVPTRGSPGRARIVTLRPR